MNKWLMHSTDAEHYKDKSLPKWNEHHCLCRFATMASNRGGGPGCLGRIGIVLYYISYKVVAADPVVHSVLPDQVLPCIPSSTVPGIVKVNKVPRLFLAHSRRKQFAAGIQMVVKTQEEKLLFIQTDFLTQPLQILFFSQGVKRLFPCCRFH